jgi:hypothetical protein
MRKVAPSVMVREQIEQILRDGVDTETNLLSTLAHLGLKQIVQQALEQEQEDFLGRGRYERQESTAPRRGAPTVTATRIVLWPPPRERSR